MTTDTREALAALPLEESLKRAYYYDDAGNWRGPDATEFDRWHAVARAALATQPAQATPNFALIWTICRFALHSPTEVLMHQIERLANELHGKEQQMLQALLIRARNPKAQKPASRLVPAAQPSAQGEAVACVTEEMVTAYLTANDAYWKRIDGEPTKLGKWRNGTPSEATRVSLMAALAAAPAAPAQAVPCPNCRGEGTVRAMTQEHGPDDYEFDMVCPMCSGGQEAPAAQPSAQGEAVATVHGWVNPAPHAAQPMVPSPSFTVRIGASAPAAPAQAVPLTDEHVNAVVRSVQPYLSTDCKAWRELTETCRYWLQAERGIAPKAAQGR